MSGEGWSRERKERSVRATQARIAAERGRFEESLSWMLGCSTPLLWDELGLAGFACMMLGQTDRGISFYRQSCAAADADNAPLALAQLCRALVRAGQMDAAVETARQVRKTRPQLLAAVGAAAGRAEVVLEAAGPAGEAWADSGAQSSWRAKAVALKGGGETGAAVLAELQRAVRQDPSREEAWTELAEHAARHHPWGLQRAARAASGAQTAHLLSVAGKHAGLQLGGAGGRSGANVREERVFGSGKRRGVEESGVVAVCCRASDGRRRGLAQSERSFSVSLRCRFGQRECHVLCQRVLCSAGTRSTSRISSL